MKEHNKKTLQIYTYAPSLFIIFVMLGFMADAYYPTNNFASFWWQPLGLTLLVVGTLLIWWAMMSLKKIRRSIKRREGVNMHVGAYAYMRHPDYIGYILIGVGFGFALQSVIVVVSSVLFWYILRKIADHKEVHVSNDESPMRDHYREYTKKVKRYF